MLLALHHVHIGWWLWATKLQCNFSFTQTGNKHLLV